MTMMPQYSLREAMACTMCTNVVMAKRPANRIAAGSDGHSLFHTVLGSVMAAQVGVLWVMVAAVGG